LIAKKHLKSFAQKRNVDLNIEIVSREKKAFANLFAKKNPENNVETKLMDHAIIEHTRHVFTNGKDPSVKRELKSVVEMTKSVYNLNWTFVKDLFHHVWLDFKAVMITTNVPMISAIQLKVVWMYQSPVQITTNVLPNLAILLLDVSTNPKIVMTRNCVPEIVAMLLLEIAKTSLIKRFAIVAMEDHAQLMQTVMLGLTLSILNLSAKLHTVTNKLEVALQEKLKIADKNANKAVLLTMLAIMHNVFWTNNLENMIVFTLIKLVMTTNLAPLILAIRNLVVSMKLILIAKNANLPKSVIPPKIANNMISQTTLIANVKDLFVTSTKVFASVKAPTNFALLTIVKELVNQEMHVKLQNVFLMLMEIPHTVQEPLSFVMTKKHVL
jgi:hypothetical protein